MKLEGILTVIILFIFMSVMTYTSHQLSNCQRDKAKQIATQQNIELKVKDEIIEENDKEIEELSKQVTTLQEAIVTNKTPLSAYTKWERFKSLFITQVY